MMWILLFLQDESVLKYGGDRGAVRTVASEVTLDLELKGSENALTFVRSASPFFNFQKIKWKAEGDRRIASIDRKSEARTLRTEFAQARVDGSFDDEKFEYDFDRKSPPGDLKDDKLKGMLWVIVMNGHPQTLTPAGVLKAADPNQDALGEALMHISWPAARLQEKAVKAGDTWETKWSGERKDKLNGGHYEFTQKAKLEKLADGRAEIAIELAGVMEGFRKDGNAEKQETKAEATAKVVLDTKSGLALGWESKGKVHATFKGTGADGEEVEISVTFAMASKLETKE